MADDARRNGAAAPDARRGQRRTRLATSVELQQHVRAWREKVDTRSIPGAPRDKGLSQEWVAHLVGCSVSYYRRLERGERGNYSSDFLDRLTNILRLNPDERNMLYLLATGRPAAAIIRPSNAAINATMERLILSLSWPAYISDASWDVLVHNDAMVEWFPHIRYVTNVMRWTFLYPEARLQLVDWETSWAPPMIAQMHAVKALWPSNQRLAHLIGEVLQGNEFARDLWDQPVVYVHPDGDRRRLNLPFADKPREIEILAFTPMRAVDLRMVMLVPVDSESR